MRLADIRAAIRGVIAYQKVLSWFPLEEDALEDMRAVLEGALEATGKAVEGEDASGASGAPEEAVKKRECCEPSSQRRTLTAGI